MGDHARAKSVKKWGLLCPFPWGADFLSKTMLCGTRPTSVPSGILIHPAIWPQQTWAKNWGAVPHFLGAAGSPSNTMSPGPRPTSTPSSIIIHPTIWPQYTNVTDRTDRQDRQRSDSIGPTVLETVAQILNTVQCTVFQQYNVHSDHVSDDIGRGQLALMYSKLSRFLQCLCLAINVVKSSRN